MAEGLDLFDLLACLLAEACDAVARVGVPADYVRPDVLLTSNDGVMCLPVDAKYKGYDHRRPEPGDIYQAAIYALALARTPSRSDLRCCVLLYPSADEGTANRVQRVQVRAGDSGTAEALVVGLPVRLLLDDLRRGGQRYRFSEWYAVIADKCLLPEATSGKYAVVQ